MLNIILGNSLNLLGDSLIENFSKSDPNILKPQLIIVNNMNMGRWISLYVAKSIGICANIKFMLPAQFIWEFFRDFLPYDGDSMNLEREIILWHLMEIIPKLIIEDRDNILIKIKNYLGDENNGIDSQKLYQISDVLSLLYDKYSVYRHKWLLNWENGNDNVPNRDDIDIKWQAFLWREISKGEYKNQRPNLIDRFFSIYSQCDEEKARAINEKFPQIEIFGVSMIPPVFYDIFCLLSQMTDINMYVFSPCIEYFSDIRDEKEITKIISYKVKKRDNLPQNPLHFETGNTILASMGKISRDFQNIICNTNVLFDENRLYEIPEEDTLLHKIQRDILLLRDISSYETRGRIGVNDGDISIQIHSCHSRRREIEVLHDQLLRLFDEDKNITPGDILVMAPDINEYSEIISGIFSAVPIKKYIPYSISDRSILIENPAVKAFFRVFEIAKSRFKASEILELLEIESIGRKFQIEGDDIEKIRKWVVESGIRWGLDAEHRKGDISFGFDENTWKFGFERLFLGYSMPQKEVFINNRLNYPYIQGQEALLLGNLRRFIDVLEKISREMEEKRDINDWQIYINRFIDMFFDTSGGDAHILQEIRNLLFDVKKFAKKGGFNGKVDINVLLHHLENSLSHQPSRGGYLNGKVTFSSLMPMRNIPFRCICLIGMNDEDFPRKESTQSFDLMARYIERGDRNRRDDDKQLFLECLMGARDYLYISYIGNDTRDNSEKAPSVVVSELLDYIEKNFSPDNLLEAIITRHNLQPFSPKYFGVEKGKFSYREEWIPLVTREKKDFLNICILPDESLKKVSLDNLVNFYKNPVKYFFNRRLSFYLNELVDIIPDDEELGFSNLTLYNVGNESLNEILENKILNKEYDTENIVKYQYNLQKARENLYIIYDENEMDIKTKINVIENEISDLLNPIDFNITIDGFELYGTLNNISKDYLNEYSLSEKIKAKHILNLWIKHIIINIINNEYKEYPKNSRYLYIKKGKNNITYNLYQFNEIDKEKAIDLLKDLLQIYLKGLCYPICFFPDTSYEYAKVLYNDGDEEKAYNKANYIWNPTEYNKYPESNDKYIQLVFANIDALNQEFRELSKCIFFPLLQYQYSEPIERPKKGKKNAKS